MAGFFSKKYYAAMAESELATKLLKELCLECSIRAIFFNPSLTVSIKVRFLNRLLSAMLIREFFILFFILVIICIPFGYHLYTVKEEVLEQGLSDIRPHKDSFYVLQELFLF